MLTDVAEELTCPITCALVVEPVTAEDGFLYERSAIEDWVRRPRQGPLKSPRTNAPMGPRLLEAVQVRNIIRRMEQSGAIGV